MNKIEIMSMFLISIQYNFTKPETKKLEIALQDNYEVKEINNNIVILSVSRTVVLGEDTDCFIKIDYELTASADEPWNKESVDLFCSSDLMGLRDVYSKIALLIAEISNASPFGVIITPPAFLEEKFPNK